MKQDFSLKNKLYFNKVLNEGKKVRTANFTFSYLLASDCKIGISVPKKLGNAVFRNKNKRQIKEILTTSDFFNNHLHLVIITKKRWTDLAFIDKKQQLQKDLNLILLELNGKRK